MFAKWKIDAGSYKSFKSFLAGSMLFAIYISAIFTPQQVFAEERKVVLDNGQGSPMEVVGGDCDKKKLEWEQEGWKARNGYKTFPSGTFRVKADAYSDAHKRLKEETPKAMEIDWCWTKLSASSSTKLIRMNETDGVENEHSDTVAIKVTEVEILYRLPRPGETPE